MCRKVYFPTSPVSIGLVTGMHGLLYMLLRELLTLGDPLGKDYDLETYVAQCEHQFNIGLETYDILAVPSFENIFCLTIGVSSTNMFQQLHLLTGKIGPQSPE